jgi:formimidoylglutamate deiminase
MIDYRQRLMTHHRNTFEGDGALYLVNEEIESGRKAMGLNLADHFVPGQPLDAIVYDAGSPLLGNTSMKNLLATLVYSAESRAPLGTLINGQWIVKNQRHTAEAKIRSDFTQAIKGLKNR